MSNAKEIAEAIDALKDNPTVKYLKEELSFGAKRELELAMGCYFSFDALFRELEGKTEVPTDE